MNLIEKYSYHKNRADDLVIDFKAERSFKGLEVGIIVSCISGFFLVTTATTGTSRWRRKACDENPSSGPTHHVTRLELLGQSGVRELSTGDRLRMR